jgi:hypothetical protein
MSCYTFFYGSHVHFHKKFHRAWLGSHPRTIACKKKMLLVKYILKNNKQKKDVIKTETYHHFCMWNERNRIVGVCGNGTVNTPVLVLCIGLWISHEALRYHMMNIFNPYNLWDVWWSGILPNRYILPAWKLSFFCIFFSFFFCLVPKITQSIWYKWIIY